MQLIGEVHEPIPAAPGHPVLIDDEYVRKGVASIFIEVEPLGGKRKVKITEQRTRVDWAHFIKEMLEERYTDAEKVVLVMDNLNTHNTASLYTAFPPEEAKRLADRLEIHYTPKHGSWLNIAEIELSVLKRQCLAGRIDCIEKMRAKVAAWNADRNNRLLFPIVNGPNFPDYFDRLSVFHFRLTIDVLGSAAADPDFSQIMGFSSTGIFASAHS